MKAKLSVFFDKDHTCPNKGLRDYLLSIEPDVKGLFIEMALYDGFYDDLGKLKPGTDFCSFFKSKYPEGTDIAVCINKIFNCVVNNNLVLWALGVYHEEIKSNVELILGDNNFEGLYAHIMGAAPCHKKFFREELEPLFKKKFKVTYYKSSS